jgi:hypothetical protein
VTAGGSVFVYTMPWALKEPRWQLAAFVVGFLCFVVAAEQARRLLTAER